MIKQVDSKFKYLGGKIYRVPFKARTIYFAV